VPEDEVKGFLNWDGNGALYHMSRMEIYGWMCSAGVPLKNEAGDTVAFVLADVTLEQCVSESSGLHDPHHPRHGYRGCRDHLPDDLLYPQAYGRADQCDRGAALAYVQDAEQFDDLTMMCMEYMPEADRKTQE